MLLLFTFQINRSVNLIHLKTLEDFSWVEVTRIHNSIGQYYCYRLSYISSSNPTFNVLDVGLDYSLSSETSFVPLLTCMTSLWRESKIIPNLLNEVSINPIRCSSSSLIWPAQANEKFSIPAKIYTCIMHAS